MDKISRGVWPTHDTKTSMSPTVSSERTCRLPACSYVGHSDLTPSGNDSEQVVYAHVPLPPCTIIWFWHNGDVAMTFKRLPRACWKVTVIHCPVYEWNWLRSNMRLHLVF